MKEILIPNNTKYRQLIQKETASPYSHVECGVWTMFSTLLTTLYNYLFYKIVKKRNCKKNFKFKYNLDEINGKFVPDPSIKG